MDHYGCFEILAADSGLQIKPPDPNGDPIWTAHHNGRQVGALAYSSDFDDAHGNPVNYVTDIKVHPDYKRQGIATKLWEAAGRPLHTREHQTSQGFQWAHAVGGENWDYAKHGNPQDVDEEVAW